MLMHPSTQRRSGGFTLIELLVGLTVGAIVLIGVIFSWGLAVRHQAYVLSVAALNNDMRTAMHVISQDIRRAAENPDDGSLRVDRIVEFGNDDSCVLFYAAFADDTDTLSPDVFIPSGYRFNNDDGALEVWDPLPDPDPDVAPPAPTCDDNADAWGVLIGAGGRGISVTELTFDSSESVCLNLNVPEDDEAASAPGRCGETGDNFLEILLVQIELVGEMQILGTNREFRIQDQVKVRNELLL